MHICKHIYICKYVHIYIYKHVCIEEYIYTYIYLLIYTYNTQKFRYALKSAFEHFLNLQQTKPAKLLADFVDRKMRYTYRYMNLDTCRYYLYIHIDIFI
jgi:hypothetical protein